MGDVTGQGRFGPPPVVAWGVSAQRWRDGTWSVNVFARREGGEFDRRVSLADVELADLIEAVVTEAYRLRE